MASFRIRLVGVYALFTAALLVFLTFGVSAQQQTPVPVPTPLQPAGVRGGATLIPTIDPPAPPSGEGVDLPVQVVDAVTGKGLGDVPLEVTRNPTPADRRRWLYSKTTDALGSATISNMTADTYAVTLALNGYMLSKNTVATVTLATGRKPAPLTFRMWRSSSVDGVVQDRDRNPVPNATVDILEESWIGGLRTMVVSQTTVITDAEGKFAFPAVMPGTYYLRAIANRGMVQQQLRDSPAGKQEAFVDTLYPGVPYPTGGSP